MATSAFALQNTPKIMAANWQLKPEIEFLFVVRFLFTNAPNPLIHIVMMRWMLLYILLSLWTVIMNYLG